jgi:hypothetical protein
MDAVLYAHVPSLRIDQAELPFAGGRLASLSFDEWLALDSEFEYADGKYERARPVFWIRELAIDGEPTADALQRATSAAIWPVHTAFLLDVRSPLIPTPILSCCYVAIPAPPGISQAVGRLVARLIGPMEREFIVYGSPLTFEYGAPDLAHVEKMCRLIESSGIRNAGGDILAGIEVLEETARPDSWYGGDRVMCRLHGFVRCMAATESLLLRPEEEGGGGETTQTFGRHAAALFAFRGGDRDRATKHFADLYRFRSELMHGRSMPDQDDPATGAMLREGRQLLRNVVYAALLLHRAMPLPSPLWRMLDECWGDAARQAALADALRRGVLP